MYRILKKKATPIANLQNQLIRSIRAMKCSRDILIGNSVEIQTDLVQSK